MYHRHPSERLMEAFRTRPFQGAEPESARFLFVGLDANYAPDIENSPIFPLLLEYHRDGVAFWRNHEVHHPFLLPSYHRGDGWFFHNSFSSIGFTPAEAEDVSFIELLHVPTYGRDNRLVKEDLDPGHLGSLNEAILGGRSQHIFVPDAVGRLMRASGMFPWIPREPVAGGGPLKVWFRSGSKTVYWHYHFSVYGRYETEKRKQLRAIAALRG